MASLRSKSEGSHLTLPRPVDTVFEGQAFRLRPGADPSDAEAWEQKRLWLTSIGGLHYNSEDQRQPQGCCVAGVRAEPSPETMDCRFAFVVRTCSTPASDRESERAAAADHYFATDTVEERDAWVDQITRLSSAVLGPDGTSSGAVETLSPLDVYGVPRRSSRRLSSQEQVEMSSVLRAVVSMPPGRNANIANSSPGYLQTQTEENEEQEQIDEEEQEENEPEFPLVESPESSMSSGDFQINRPARGLPKMVDIGKERIFQPCSIRRDSQKSYADRLHTALIVDWDDTIFPTTWVREDCQLQWRMSVDEQLQPGPRKTLIKNLLARLVERAILFFEEAVLHANVVIVTLAKRPWVEISMANFVPGLSKVLAEANIKIIYAQEHIKGTPLEYAKNDFMSSDAAKTFWSNVKGAAITKELDEIHSRHNASWKNVISLGDSDFERFGTIAAGEEYIKRSVEGGGTVLASGCTAEAVTQDGHLKRLRTKTIKMLDEPTVEELTAELTLLTRWLPNMVRKDSGFDFEIDNTEDNDELRDLHKKITGLDEELSWTDLAGMTSPPIT